MSLTSPIVINVPTRASLAVETKSLLFLWLANLNNKSNVCIQISSLQLFGNVEPKFLEQFESPDFTEDYRWVLLKFVGITEYIRLFSYLDRNI